MHATASTEVASALLRYLPAAHAVHAVTPVVLGWNLPVGHAVHAAPSPEDAAAPVRNLPAAQATHAAEAAAFWYVPEAHALHEPTPTSFAPVSWYVPATHGVQASPSL